MTRVDRTGLGEVQGELLHVTCNYLDHVEAMARRRGWQVDPQQPVPRGERCPRWHLPGTPWCLRISQDAYRPDQGRVTIYARQGSATRILYRVSMRHLRRVRQVLDEMALRRCR